MAWEEPKRRPNQEKPANDTMSHSKSLLAACVLISFFNLLAFPLRAQAGGNQEQEKESSPDDWVAVGVCSSEIVLATPRRWKEYILWKTITKYDWRRHELKLPNKGRRIVDAALSKTGTKLAVLYADQTHDIFDLSVSGFSGTHPTHHLPEQTYKLSNEGRNTFLDDQGGESDDYDLTTPEVHDENLPPEWRKSLNRRLSPDSCGSRRIFQIRPDPNLYAPVLEFAPGEEVFPTKTSIWMAISPISGAVDLSGEPAESNAEASKYESQWRKSLGEYRNLRRGFQAAVYYRTRSFRRSWLIEYWMYYPFDVGWKPHPHDTEHVFVEVDKVGGRVVGVFGSAHRDVNANNLYSARVRGAQTPTLPLFVLVEKGKHAMAPDVNRDGKFTPGKDVNVGPKGGQVQGIRDNLNLRTALSPYDPAMTLGRTLRDAWASKNFHSYFDEEASPTFQTVYELVPFPSLPEDKGCRSKPTPLSQKCAEYKLVEHLDSQYPGNILKPWIFPSLGFSVGFSKLEGHSLFSFGLASELRTLLPIEVPGRVSYQVSLNTFRVYMGVQYDKSVTSWLGYYFGYVRRLDPVEGNLFHAGISFDLAKRPLWSATPISFTNITLHLGPAFSPVGGFDGIHLRLSTSIVRERP